MTEPLKRLFDNASLDNPKSLDPLTRGLVRAGYGGAKTEIPEIYASEEPIRLYHFRWPGLIIAGPGPLWSNQVGGTGCQHPRLRGIYMPLPLNIEPDPDPLFDQSGYVYDRADAQSWISASNALHRVTRGSSRAKHYFKVIPKEREEEAQKTLGNAFFTAEAWIPVVIDTSGFEDISYSILQNLAPFHDRIAVITHENSD